LNILMNWIDLDPEVTVANHFLTAKLVVILFK
jgi:hypothetical protein